MIMYFTLGLGRESGGEARRCVRVSGFEERKGCSSLKESFGT
jgi:hypothetical protein